MGQPHDLYEILQVHPSAHPDVIEAAYRWLALLYHPDRNKSPEASEMMRRLNYAYEILSDPPQREAYDQQRPSGAAPGARPSRRDTPRPAGQRRQPAQTNSKRSLPTTNRSSAGPPTVVFYLVIVVTILLVVVATVFSLISN